MQQKQKKKKTGEIWLTGVRGRCPAVDLLELGAHGDVARRHGGSLPPSLLDLRLRLRLVAGTAPSRRRRPRSSHRSGGEQEEEAVVVVVVGASRWVWFGGGVEL